MLYVILLSLFVLPTSPGDGAGDIGDGDFFQRYPFLQRLSGRLDYSWAKPFPDTDMDLMDALLDTGFLTSEPADWFVVLEEGDE